MFFGSTRLRKKKKLFNIIHKTDTPTDTIDYYTIKNIFKKIFCFICYTFRPKQNTIINLERKKYTRESKAAAEEKAKSIY